MKNLYVFVFLVLALSLSSCSYHMFGGVQNLTEVQLSEDNFEMGKLVGGEAQATYIFGFGGNKKRALVEAAKKEMFKNAGLTGSQAISNVTVETKTSNYLIVSIIKVVVSGQVVTFK